VWHSPFGIITARERWRRLSARRRMSRAPACCQSWPSSTMSNRPRGWARLDRQGRLASISPACLLPVCVIEPAPTPRDIAHHRPLIWWADSPDAWEPSVRIGPPAVADRAARRRVMTVRGTWPQVSIQGVWGLLGLIDPSDVGIERASGLLTQSSTPALSAYGTGRLLGLLLLQQAVQT
jgi:hypothetical protein